MPNVPSPPPLTLPKGGGLRGIGEKFSANSGTGTGTLTIPLPATPGRSRFGPQLALTYDSGAPHGCFGLGVGLGLPSITRRTDKGLPRYDDSGDDDVYVLSGTEDLVPVTGPDGRPEQRVRTVRGTQYRVTRYRPRIEGLYARIERWTTIDTGEVHWRSISRDNVTTLYGRDASSRIADPADPLRRVFSWLICASYDGKGNAIDYRYVAENDTSVDLAAAHERNRPPESRTANRYVKSIRYGNRTSRLAEPGPADGGWLFELVFDYGEHDEAAPTPGDSGPWLCRNDPFSSHRSGFEVRTYRLCQRILMFHHFPDEQGVGADCLVRSLSLRYRDSRGVRGDRRRGHPAGALLASATLAGHRRSGSAYITQSMPPLELTYSGGAPAAEVRELDAFSAENLPAGIDGGVQWADLDGESIAGALVSDGGAWFYKPNEGGGRLGALRRLADQPSLPLGDGQGRLVDLVGDGRLDLVALEGSAPGLYERTEDGGWTAHRPFTSLPVLDWDDPDLRFCDVTGDGSADILVTRGGGIVWHPSLGEEGFGPAHRVIGPADQGVGPWPVFDDGTRSLRLADFSGDGLPDLVSVGNGEVCYWPNLGYGRFGPKVVMDNAPLFDSQDLFDQNRLRLADFDGSGPTDLLYLGPDGVDLYTNQMGNSWSPATRLPACPPIDDLASVSVVDLLGTGTACLVWSSTLSADEGRRIRYVDLMGGTKPHLLVRIANNLGAETAISYASSTTFYLRDRAAGRPWVTRLPFPVQVVEKVEAYDRISRNRLVTRYSYRDGYFDERDREFRGFASVVQEKREEIATLARSDASQPADNLDPAHHVPPVRTHSWFHTGAWLGRDRLSGLLAGQYYPPPEHAVPAALAWLLDDTPLPPGLSYESERDACRALKGRLLRQEVYALDGTEREPHPYSVLECNYTLRQLQAPRAGRPAVFAVDPRETLTATCERRPEDARVAHEVVLDTDAYGTVLHSVSLAYRRADADPKLPERTRERQATTLATETRTLVTTAVDTTVDDTPAGGPATEPDAYRVPVPYDVTTSQLTGAAVDGAGVRLSRDEVRRLTGGQGRTVVARQRTRFDSDLLDGPLPFGAQGALGLPYETYTLALTGELVAGAFGNRVSGPALRDAGYVEVDGAWWAPSGTVRYAPADVGGAADVLAYARRNFCLPHRFVDPFAAAAGAEYGMSVEYDPYRLLPVETVDAAGNRTTAGERDATDERTQLLVDYRVLAPSAVTDPNRNRVFAAYDALGRPAAVAVAGKPGADGTGDRLDRVAADPTAAELAAFRADPSTRASGLLDSATTRYVYDTDAYTRTRDTGTPQPVSVATLARERHVNDAQRAGGGLPPVQVSFVYIDGLGREVQHKVPAEPDPSAPGVPRWVGSGSVVFNDAGNPVVRYEPFLTSAHAFEFAVRVGVGSVLCYDPLGRVVATLRPDRTYEKTVIGSWRQDVWDANDTATTDPAADPDVGALIGRLPAALRSPTWYQERITGELGPTEEDAARRTELHQGTFASVCSDPLGRGVLMIARNRTPGAADGDPPQDTEHRTHTVLDILGNRLAVLDSTEAEPGATGADGDRLVLRCTYDLTQVLLVEESMEAGTRRLLSDIGGQPVVVWEVTGAGADRIQQTSYDRLRRPVGVVLGEGAAARITERITYGEAAPEAARYNLRGQVWQARDGSGLLTNTYDVHGNPATAGRRLARAHREVLDWAGSVPLEPETWTTGTAYDALSRPTLRTHPDTTTVRFIYGAGGLLDLVTVRLPGEQADTPFVSGIDYNARGQRTLVAHGNGVTTTYAYDDRTFRLSALDTVRSAPANARRVQALRYTYDPVGNITHIQDDAQPSVFHLNTRVDASADYVYDSLYRLVRADGREHLAAGSDGRLKPTGPGDLPRTDPADRQALGRYRERYTYDLAGNLTRLRHIGLTPGNDGWTRTFVHAEASQLLEQQADFRSNRLTRTETDSAVATYGYDAHGNMTTLPPLQRIEWDHRNRLSLTQMQNVTTARPETTHYRYDASGNRIRQVTERAAGTVLGERIYLDDFEIFRRYDAGGSPTLVRTTSHIMDGDQRVALIETRTDTTPRRRLIRYQYADHLGSAVGELDDGGRWISYEGYYPYGSIALAFTRDGVVGRRYKYTNMERDPSGLARHGNRYYAAWLCQWTSADPVPATSRYLYADSNPIVLVDLDGALPKPKPTVVVMPANNDIRGKVAHEVILPELTQRVNTEVPGGYYKASNEVPTGPYGSRTRGSAHAGRMDFTIDAAGSGTHITELKPLATSAQHTDQVFNYGQRANTPLSAKPGTKLNELVAENPELLRPVTLENTDYLLSTPEQPGFIEYLEIERVTVNVPTVEYKSTLKASTPAAPVPPTETAPPAPGRSLGAISRGVGSSAASAAKFGLGHAGLLLSVVQNAPHFWDDYYDTADADIEYIFAKALNAIGIGTTARRPPHAGGDPYEYFRGTKLENVDWNSVIDKYNQQNTSWIK
ncbi:SpvB/TcaC N-terminal domain-containing protein [Streptomyces sp. NPDC007808]|uniref:SpvB/TcaC N-terminal domain-containing protein n=1 Tax=Streptomyces sp. NPDC007808 TaxID=3364779 RepID=UPI0036A975F8